MKGLLGHNQMSDPNSTEDVRGNAMGGLGINLPGADDTQLQNPFGSPEEVLQFQQQFNADGGGLSEDGQWGPNTMDAYQQYMRDM